MIHITSPLKFLPSFPAISHPASVISTVPDLSQTAVFAAPSLFNLAFTNRSAQTSLIHVSPDTQAQDIF